MTHVLWRIATIFLLLLSLLLNPCLSLAPRSLMSSSSSSSSSLRSTTTRPFGALATTTTSLLASTTTSTTTTTTKATTDYDIVKVDLDDGRDYPIYIGGGYSQQEASSLLQSHVHGTKVFIITNDRIAPLYLEKYVSIFSHNNDDNNNNNNDKTLVVETLVLPDGEENKSLEVLETILHCALQFKLDRRTTFVALGGGVIGDMVGFASAIYQRGINFIQIPTTVMAMVDSSVGGKTGVNHVLGKNMIGAFHQPQCVFVDTDTLSTLPDRELQSGISEIIKYGLIRDAPFFEWQERHMDELLQRKPDALRYAIKRSCQNKAAVVRADEKEAGIRATLNLGHTFGHAIENGCGYGTFLHGEAVAIGTAMAATMSRKMQWIDGTLVDRIYDILRRAHLPVTLPPDSPMDRETFLRLMSVDKKVENGNLRLILLKGPLGECVFTGDFDDQAMIETIDQFVAECSSAGGTTSSS